MIDSFLVFVSQSTTFLSSVVFAKYDAFCGQEFWSGARRADRAYPEWICKGGATKCLAKRTAAQRVAPKMAR